MHYGYIISVLSALCLVTSQPGQSVCIGVTNQPLLDKLGISQTMLSTLLMLGTLTSAVLMPWAGQIVDAVGVRVSATLVSLALGFSCQSMHYVNNPISLYLWYFMMRFTGQGCMILLGQTSANQWWIAKRGLVTGINGSIQYMFMIGVLPVLMINLINNYGVIQTYECMFKVLIFVITPILFIGLREKPEDQNLLPDASYLNVDSKLINGNISEIYVELDELECGGFKHIKSYEPKCIKEIDVCQTYSEAIATSYFWAVNLTISFLVAIVTGFDLYITDQLEIYDMKESGKFIQPILAITIIMVRIPVGQMLDYISPHILLCVATSLIGYSMLLTFIVHKWTFQIFVILHGIGAGIFMNLEYHAQASKFGRKHLGSIQGFANAFTIFSSSLGPLPFGISKDINGSFDSAAVFQSILAIFFSIQSQKQARIIK